MIEQNIGVYKSNFEIEKLNMLHEQLFVLSLICTATSEFIHEDIDLYIKFIAQKELNLHETNFKFIIHDKQ